MEFMNVKQIVKKYLTENGYDGLYGRYCIRGCQKRDLISCGGNPKLCKSGYIKRYEDSFGKTVWEIVPKKEG